MKPYSVVPTGTPVVLKTRITHILTLSQSWTVNNNSNLERNFKVSNFESRSGIRITKTVCLVWNDYNHFYFL